MPKEKSKDLLACYLVVGEDALKKRTTQERLRKRMEAYGPLDFNHEVFDAQTATGEAVVDACNTLPFASEKRLVEVNEIDKFQKASQDLIVDYLSHPNETTVLLLVADKLAKNTRLYKAVAAIGKNSVISCEPKKRYDLVRDVRNMAPSHGFTMTAAAAERLVELVGEDTIRIDTELRKLSLAKQGGNAVTDRDVDALVARTAAPKPWEFADAFASRNLRRCIDLLEKLDATPTYLLSLCVTRIRELICAQSLDARGQSNRLPEELGLSANQGWRVKNHLKWSRAFRAGKLEAALISARDCERAMKSGGDQNDALVDWLLDVLS